MKTANQRKQQFRNKDIIYREGDPATRAFTIIAGKVELFTEVDGKEKHLGLLGPGRSLGEQDVSHGRHQATAIAAGTVTLRPLDNQALAKFKPVAPTTSLLARLLAPVAAPPKSGRRFSFFGWFRHLRQASQPSDPSRIEVRIAPMAPSDPTVVPVADGPDMADLAATLEAAFAGLDGVRALALKKPIAVPEDTEPENHFHRLHWAARQALAQAESDVAVTFEVIDGGRKLRLLFLPLGIQGEDPPGVFEASHGLVLPIEMDEPFGRLVAATALASTVPLTDTKKARLVKTLPTVIEQVSPIVEALEQHPGLSDREKVIARLFYANLLSLMSGPAGRLDGYRTAADIYGQAIETLTEDTDALDRAVAQRALGAVLPILAPELEHLAVTADGEEGAAGPLAQAAEYLEAAAIVFSREAHPKAWAALQTRLGQICYRIDAQEGDQDLLKKALNHYQAALQVFNRVDHPLRWAEVMNNIGQAAAILGEQLKSVELFEKSIEACSSALEVRQKLQYPLLWAATQNNLGSALFMLAKTTHDQAQLESAREAFALAKGVYEGRGIHRLTMITEKNLKRVESLMVVEKPTSPPPLPWEPRDYAAHLPDETNEEPDDEEEGDMSVYELPDDDENGAAGRS